MRNNSLIAKPSSPMQARETVGFYYLLNALIAYAARELNLESNLVPSISSPNVRERDCASYVLDNIWNNPSIIRKFVALNPQHLTQEELNCVALWQYALKDVFVCFEQEGLSNILATNGQRLFEVSSLHKPIACLVGTMPALAIMTLLPYRGKIVCDGRFIHIGTKRRSRHSRVIERFVQGAAEYPLVASADELIAYKHTLPPNHDVTFDFSCALIANTP